MNRNEYQNNCNCWFAITDDNRLFLVHSEPAEKKKSVVHALQKVRLSGCRFALLVHCNTISTAYAFGGNSPCEQLYDWENVYRKTGFVPCFSLKIGQKIYKRGEPLDF